MVRAWIGLLVVVSLMVATGCGGNGGSDEANTAVEPDYWGSEHAVYAEYVDWEDGQDVPGGEQWSSPPAGERYVKFTYYGEMLIKLEAFDDEGSPSLRFMPDASTRYVWGEYGLAVDRKLRRAVATESVYAANGEVLEQKWYGTKGDVLIRHAYQYGDAGQPVEMTKHADGKVTERHVYAYDDAGRLIEETVYGADGKEKTNARKYTYSADGQERTERMELYSDGGDLTHVGTFREEWDPVREDWRQTGETWEQVG